VASAYDSTCDSADAALPAACLHILTSQDLIVEMSAIPEWPCTVVVKLEGLELPKPDKPGAVSAAIDAADFFTTEKHYTGELLQELCKWCVKPCAILHCTVHEYAI
jgi:hypothetical protein